MLAFHLCTLRPKDTNAWMHANRSWFGMLACKTLVKFKFYLHRDETKPTLIELRGNSWVDFSASVKYVQACFLLLSVEPVWVDMGLKAPASQAPESLENSRPSSVSGARGGAKRKPSEQPEDEQSWDCKAARRSSRILAAGDTNNASYIRPFQLNIGRVTAISASAAVSPHHRLLLLSLPSHLCIVEAVSQHFFQAMVVPSCKHVSRLVESLLLWG